jgi:methionine synthase II (cobalamin-independent)
MQAEIAEIAQAVPAGELAIQWDIAVETIGVLEDPDNAAGLTATEVAGAIARVSNAVPAAIELGLHICYGDRDHKHFIEPRDLAVGTAFANLLARTIRPPLGWVHMPVPRDRADESYFAPLESLALGAGTQLYLGLVHLSDGVDGARRRISAANRFVNAYGIATECGLGRRPAETVPAVLALHRDVAALND